MDILKFILISYSTFFIASCKIGTLDEGIIYDHCYKFITKDNHLMKTSNETEASSLCSSIKDPRCSNFIPIKALNESDWNTFHLIMQRYRTNTSVWSSGRLHLDDRRSQMVKYKNESKFMIDHRCHSRLLEERIYGEDDYIQFIMKNSNYPCWYPLHKRKIPAVILCQAKSVPVGLSTTTMTPVIETNCTDIVSIVSTVLHTTTTKPVIETNSTTIVPTGRHITSMEPGTKTNSTNIVPTGLHTTTIEPVIERNCTHIVVNGTIWLCKANISSSEIVGNFQCESDIDKKFLPELLDSKFKCMREIEDKLTEETSSDELIDAIHVLAKLVSMCEEQLLYLPETKKDEFKTTAINSTFNLLDKFLSKNLTNIWNSIETKKRQDQAVTLLNVIDRVTLIMKTFTKPVSISYSSIGFISAPISGNEVTYSENIENYHDNYVTVLESDAVKDALNESSEERANGLAVSYTNLADYLGLDDHYSSVSVKKGNTSISSRMLGLSFGESSLYFDDYIIKVYLQHTIKNGKNAQCVFWNSTSNQNSSGFWDNRGCIVESSSEHFSICKCNHLTNFAVLMDHGEVILNNSNTYKILDIMSMVLLPISIIFLIATVICFLAVRHLRTRKNKITLNLCICLAMSQILILGNIDGKLSKIACMVIAISLQYFLLATFSWFLLEGYFLYQMVIKVFRSNNIRLVWYYVFGYGIPVIITGVSVSIFPHGYTIENGRCWLTNKNSFIWSFVGPVTFVISVNLILLVLAIHSTFSIKQNINRKQQVKRRLKGTATLLFLLGITWIAGLFFPIPQASFMAYIFVLLNASQGIFMFLFQIAFNKQNYKEITKAWNDRRSEKMFSISTSMTPLSVSSSKS